MPTPGWQQWCPQNTLSANVGGIPIQFPSLCGNNLGSAADELWLTAIRWCETSESSPGRVGADVSRNTDRNVYITSRQANSRLCMHIIIPQRIGSNTQGNNIKFTWRWQRLASLVLSKLMTTKPPTGACQGALSRAFLSLSASQPSPRRVQR